MRWLLILCVSLVGCGTVQPTEKVCLNRQMVTQAIAKVAVLYEQVAIMEAAACREGRLSPKDCDKAAELQVELKAARRDISAALLFPEYEVNWAKLIQAIEYIGKVLDAIPFP